MRLDQSMSSTPGSARASTVSSISRFTLRVTSVSFSTSLSVSELVVLWNCHCLWRRRLPLQVFQFQVLSLAGSHFLCYGLTTRSMFGTPSPRCHHLGYVILGRGFPILFLISGAPRKFLRISYSGGSIRAPPSVPLELLSTSRRWLCHPVLLCKSVYANQSSIHRNLNLDEKVVCNSLQCTVSRRVSSYVKNNFE